jgi:hypothetical protein
MMDPTQWAITRTEMLEEGKRERERGGGREAQNEQVAMVFFFSKM